MPGWNALEHAFDLGQLHQAPVQGAVEHSYGERSWLASNNVRKCVEQSRACWLTIVECWPPVPHNLAARSRSEPIEMRMHSRVGWAPQSEGFGC
jgi:hypothetical protein